jgi:hypothetical protein
MTEHISLVVSRMGATSYIAVLVVLLYVALTINAKRKGR